MPIKLKLLKFWHGIIGCDVEKVEMACMRNNGTHRKQFPFMWRQECKCKRIYITEFNPGSHW